MLTNTLLIILILLNIPVFVVGLVTIVGSILEPNKDLVLFSMRDKGHQDE